MNILTLLGRSKLRLTYRLKISINLLLASISQSHVSATFKLRNLDVVDIIIWKTREIRVSLKDERTCESLISKRSNVCSATFMRRNSAKCPLRNWRRCVYIQMSSKLGQKRTLDFQFLTDSQLDFADYCIILFSEGIVVWGVVCVRGSIQSTYKRKVDLCA